MAIPHYCSRGAACAGAHVAVVAWAGESCRIVEWYGGHACCPPPPPPEPMPLLTLLNLL